MAKEKDFSKKQEGSPLLDLLSQGGKPMELEMKLHLRRRVSRRGGGRG